MAQEFTIKSQDIEDKINQLLPTQGGFQPGVDFSASTMVVPIVDLTETAEGSSLRQDLQSAFSLTNTTHNELENSNATLVNTTGFYLVDVYFTMKAEGTNDRTVKIDITDGISTKSVFRQTLTNTSANVFSNGNKRFIVFLGAGDSLTADSSGAQCFLNVITRQLADIDGNLTTVS